MSCQPRTAAGKRHRADLCRQRDGDGRARDHGPAHDVSHLVRALTHLPAPDSRRFPRKLGVPRR